MNRLNLLVLGLCLVLLSGCGTWWRTASEDPRILSRCSPAQDLLTKNYKRGGNLNIPLYGAGALFERTGAVLSGAEADRVSKVDAACRAWVYGAINDEKYASILLEVTSATVVQTTGKDDRAEVGESVKRYLDDLKSRGLLPEQLNPSDLTKTIKELGALTPDELSKRLEQSFEPVSSQIGRYADIAGKNQVMLLRRFDDLDRRLSELESRAPKPPPQSDYIPIEKPVEALKRLSPMDVYFSSGSIELNYDARSRLSEEAKTWVEAGVTIDVMGFADSRGYKAMNEVLATQRAQTVAALLTKLNVRVGAVAGGGIGSGSTDNDQLRYVRVRPRTPVQ